MLYRLYLWIYDMYGFSPVFEEKIVKDPPGWRRMATQHLFRFQLLHKARSADVAIPDAAATWWITMPATFLCTNVKNIFLRGDYLGIVLSSTKLKCSVIWGFLLPIMVRSLWGRYIPYGFGHFFCPVRFFPNTAMSGCKPCTYINRFPEILDLSDWFRQHECLV